jgi:hypothetical protein
MTTMDSDAFPEKVPDSVVAEAKAAFVRKAQGDTAVLTHDSLIDDDDPATDHRLRFEHPRLLIDLQVSVVSGMSHLLGHIDPAAPLRAQLETAGTGISSTASIDDGVFTFRDVPHGTVRIIVLATGDDPLVHTDWFLI